MRKHVLLTVASFIVMILGIINLIGSISTFVKNREYLQMASALGLGGFAAFAVILAVILCALYIITGLVGLRGNSKTACIVLGIICAIFAIISIAGGGGIGGILLLVGSVLYLIGAFMSSKDQPTNYNNYNNTPYQQ